MTFDVKALLVEIEGIHSDAEIDQEITDKVNAAVTAATANLTPPDVSGLQTQLDATNAALQAVVDKLTAAPAQTESSSAALATAQNALSAQSAGASTGAAASSGASGTSASAGSTTGTGSSS